MAGGIASTRATKVVAAKLTVPCKFGLTTTFSDLQSPQVPFVEHLAS
jgi:hypothetical protein